MTKIGSVSGWAEFIDEAWLSRRQEAALEPDLPIIDPHHHFWGPPRPKYLLPDLQRDMARGHRILATMHMETLGYYREDGPDHLKPVGETETVVAMAKEAPEGPGLPRVAAGIIGQADMTLGDRVAEVLEAHIEAGEGRFRGVRCNLFHDANIDFGYPGPPPGLAASPVFRKGFAWLEKFGLSCDTMAFHTNLPEVADLAGAFPDTVIIANHLGVPLGHGIYGERREETFAVWAQGIRQLARHDNVRLKIGGLTGPFFGTFEPFHFREQPDPPSSEAIAEAYRPLFEVAIDAFGPQRCMFESNFPADKFDVDYGVLWNAFKRLAAGFSPDEKYALFSGVAATTYRLAV